MAKYTIEKKYYKNIWVKQKNAMLKDFFVNQNGDIEIEYKHKGYKCNDKKIDMNSRIKAISLFSGAGGFDIGCQLAGVPVISTLDIFEDSVKTMELNPFFKNSIHECKDITKLEKNHFNEIIKNEKFDKLIVIGGPPCQPFSKAGYWVTNKKRNSETDPRNMIKPYFDIIRQINPDGFVLENVESLLHPSNKKTFDKILSNIKQLGYHYSLLKVNAANYGIPQKRKRVFFLASKKPIDAKLTQTHGNLSEIKKNKYLKPYERVIDWIGTFDNGKYCEDENLSIVGKWEKEIKQIPFGMNYIALSKRENHPNPIFIAGKRYWSSLLKLNPLLPSWTIIASPGHWEGPFHWKNRRMNIRELAAIQTFPDDYLFYGSICSKRKQIGNAVPPLLAKQIIEELCKWI